MIRILVVDDHAIVRAGVRALLSEEEDLEIVAEASNGHEAVAAVEQHRPDVVLLDLSMPGGDGAQAIARIRSSSPGTRVLVLSMHSAPDHVRRALQAGADGYLVKGAEVDSLVGALRQVAAGERFLGPEAARVPMPSSDEKSELERLTPRERDVLQLVAEGHTNREIAVVLGIGMKTVDTHRTSLMTKLGLHDAPSITRFALRHGLVAID